MSKDESGEPRTGAAHPGFGEFQIAKALKTWESHREPATRERALERARQWLAVLDGICSGRLAIGARQPVQGMPVWATPQVITGGFATGESLAGGPLEAHEKERLGHLGYRPGLSERQFLNLHFLSDAGLAEMTQLVASGRYEIQVPEEGALLVVAWLVSTGKAELAGDLIEVLAPQLDKLRFYPVPSDRAMREGSRVFLESVGTVSERLRRIEPKPRVMAQREAIQVWRPLYDRMIGLFLETVEGEVPSIEKDPQGRWVSPATRKFFVVGGWPCQSYPESWRARADQLVAECEQARSSHRLCQGPSKPGSSFFHLQSLLKRCAADPLSLTGREVGTIRLILARHVTRFGAQGSDRLQSFRLRQARDVAGPSHDQLARVVELRLASLPAGEGLDDLEPAVREISEEEAVKFRIPAGTTIPPSIRRKVVRCQRESVEALVELGIIPSAETLARVIPQLCSSWKAGAFDDPQLRKLHGALYRAFRRRRSLLLLNLEKQVQFCELPWVAAIEPFRRKDASTREVALQAFKELAILTLRAFPQAIVPNKLLQEFKALAQDAGLKLPLVEELAADIFMNDFSPKYTEAAKRCADGLEGSLYARYYDIDLDAVRSLPESEPKPKGWGFRKSTEPSTHPLVAVCADRAGVDLTGRWDIARNGMIIEQAQILTTQNLAVLFEALGLASELREDLPDMAQRCFRWICRRCRARTFKRHDALILRKNSAYAWRQMVYFLSHQSADEVKAFIRWAEAQLQTQPESVRDHLDPVLRGLAEVVAGRSQDSDSGQAAAVRCFLGWIRNP